MAYFKTCPLCGGNLDPGEHCDCQWEKEKEAERMSRFYKAGEMGQLTFCFEGEEGEVERTKNAFG